MFIFDQLKKGDSPLQNVALLILFCMVVLLGRLWFVQVVSSSKYVELHEDQSFRTVRIPAVRGKILDRNGTPLAENQPTYNVSLYLDELHKEFDKAYVKQRKAITNKLASDEINALRVQARLNVVSNIVVRLSNQLQQPIVLDPKKLQDHYYKSLVMPFPVVQNVTPAQIAKFEEQPFNNEGVDLELVPTRVYPFHQTGAHVLGYLRKSLESMEGEDSSFNFYLLDFKGELGIEGQFDAILHGTAGRKTVQINRLGYRQNEVIDTKAEPGKNVVLTIDIEVQKAAETALRTSALGVNTRGAVVVLNARNGDILALASNPTYDPGTFLNGVTTEEMKWLNDDFYKPQRNRATQEIYQPGSIFKIVSGLAALESGVIDPSTIYNSRGYYELPGEPPIHDTAPAGPYDFKTAFKKSSNSYFIEYGLRAGLDRMSEIGTELGLGEKCGVPTRQESAGIFPTKARLAQMKAKHHPWTLGKTAHLCIGQDQIAVTPLQMAIMTAAIANGGKVVAPRLVQRIEPQEQLPDRNEIQEFPSKVRGELHVSQRNLQIIREAMLADTDESGGTAFDAFHLADRRTPKLPNFHVCGKTGTAEIKKTSKAIVDDKTTWFASYAPYENPKYVVLVMIESGGSGGKTCAPVAEQVYSALVKMEQRGSPTPNGQSVASN